jgi:hypothetical protein
MLMLVMMMMMTMMVFAAADDDGNNDGLCLFQGLWPMGSRSMGQSAYVPVTSNEKLVETISTTLLNHNSPMTSVHY